MRRALVQIHEAALHSSRVGATRTWVLAADSLGHEQLILHDCL